MASTPVFSTGTNATNVVNVSAANTARDGSGSITTLVTGVASGTLVTRVHCHATVATAAAVLNFWYSSDSGTTWRLIGDLTVAAVTPGTTAAAWSGDFVPPGGSIIVVGTTGRLGVTTTIAQSTNFAAIGGDLT